MPSLRNFLLLLALLPLGGCATLMGDATYVYTKTSADQCNIQINSRRSLSEGATISINGCDVTVDAKSLDTNASRDLALFNLLGNIILPRTNIPRTVPPTQEEVNASE